MGIGIAIANGVVYGVGAAVIAKKVVIPVAKAVGHGLGAACGMLVNQLGSEKKEHKKKEATTEEKVNSVERLLYQGDQETGEQKKTTKPVQEPVYDEKTIAWMKKCNELYGAEFKV